MIKVKFELLGIAKSSCGKKFEIQLEKGTTIEDFLTKKLKYKKEVVRFFDCRIAGKKVRADRVLKRGDSVQLLLPIAGGQ